MSGALHHDIIKLLDIEPDIIQRTISGRKDVTNITTVSTKYYFCLKMAGNAETYVDCKLNTFVSVLIYFSGIIPYDIILSLKIISKCKFENLLVINEKKILTNVLYSLSNTRKL